MARFEIICQNSLDWLKTQPDQSINNVITGLPDLNELGEGTTLDNYLIFFNEATNLIFRKVKPSGYAIFIQTDRRYQGQLVDKSYWLTNSAYKNKYKLLWHKIVCQRDVGKIDLFRPTYSHILCYSISGTPGEAFPDVLPVGGKLYENSTPYNAAKAMAKFIAKRSPSVINKSNDIKNPDVVDPFVGQGTIGCAVLSQGLSFLGLDLDPEQCRLTSELLGSL